MRCPEVGVSKTPKFPIACNIDRVETKNIPSPPKPNIFYFTLLLPLALRYFQHHPYQQERMGDKPEKFTACLTCKGESGQAPEGSEGNLKPDPEGGTASVHCEGDPTKSVYISFDPIRISTINSRKLNQ